MKKEDYEKFTSFIVIVFLLLQVINTILRCGVKGTIDSAIIIGVALLTVFVDAKITKHKINKRKEEIHG